jgi:hypothetical protein
MSWAAIAKAPAVAPAPIIDDSETKPRIAVIDANAIINGEGLLNLIRFNDKIVTTAEVLKEIRDKKSRDALAALPFTIETREPSDESIRAGQSSSSNPILQFVHFPFPFQRPKHTFSTPRLSSTTTHTQSPNSPEQQATSTPSPL